MCIDSTHAHYSLHELSVTLYNLCPPSNKPATNTYNQKIIHILTEFHRNCRNIDQTQNLQESSQILNFYPKIKSFLDQISSLDEIDSPLLNEIIGLIMK